MADVSNKPLMVITLILALAGVGMGGYGVYVIQSEGIQGPEGPQGITGTDGLDGLDGEDGEDGEDGINGTDGLDGIDAPGYYCSSPTEIYDALTAIGIGTGRIVITSNMTLSSPIIISQGGTYIIQGESPGITIDCGSNLAFQVDDVKSCKIEELIIDASGLSAPVAVIDVTSSNVEIENLKILGDADQLGYGIYCTADNLQVDNCEISQMQIGIFVNGGNNSYIVGNTVEDCALRGIYFTSNADGGIIQNNVITGSFYGIELYGFNHMVAKNYIVVSEYIGIYLQCNNSIISENRVIGIPGDYLNQITGINVHSVAGDNLLTGNIISGINNTGVANGFGFAIVGHYNLIIGNKLFENEFNINVSPPADNELYGNMFS